MEKERYDYVCVQTEQGREIFVRHAASGEEGQALSCEAGRVTVKNTSGQERTWPYAELEEITRSKEEWPRRD